MCFSQRLALVGFADGLARQDSDASTGRFPPGCVRQDKTATEIALRFPSGDTSRFGSPTERLRQRLQRAFQLRQGHPYKLSVGVPLVGTLGSPQLQEAKVHNRV
jgi:hypothetical protein